MNNPMKAKRSFQDRLPLILAFAIPILIMLGIFAGKEIWPFGDNCFLRTDLYHQYVAFFEDLGDRMREGKSLFFAFDIGLGSNYSALFAYYLCGPLHLLAFLIPTEYMIEFITFLIVLKIGLCGWAMAWYLSKRFNTRHFGITICGICYALSGYLAAYSWNVMWLDVLWLGVIALYGLEKLIKENKPILYCVSLALAILCNYYISIMLCAFLALYFLNRLIAYSPLGWKQVLRKTLSFAFYSLIAGAIAAVLVLPAAFALKGTASSGSIFPKTLTNYFSIVEMLARHLVVVDCEIGLDHWPNIYSGVLVFLLVPLYYMNRKISFREKIANSMLLGFLLLSFNMNMLDFMWHGFHYPNSLPSRFSFLYTFLLTSMCFEGFQKWDTIKKESLVRVMWGAIFFILLAELITDSKEIPYYACYASIAFIALYTLFAYLNKAGYLERSSMYALMLCVLIVEMGLNTAVTSVSYVRRSDFMMFNDSFDTLVAEAERDKVFTRVERQYIRTKNDGAYFGYNSASIFSSTTNKAISEFYKKVGLEGNTNAYAITGATPFMWSFLDIEYKLTDARLPDSPVYELITSAQNRKEGTNYLYRNLYTLPLAYLVPQDVGDLWNPNSSSPIRSQNSYANLAAGVGNVFDSVNPNISGTEMTYTADQAGHYFVHVTGGIKKVTATVNGERSRTWDSLDRNYLVDFGYVNEGDQLKLVATDKDVSMAGNMHRLNMENFIAFHQKLSANPLQITAFTDKTFKTEIRGTVDAQQDSLLVYSIPIDPGWHATVDGQDVEITPLAEAFVGVKVPAGHHEIVIDFVPEGFQLGLMVSLGGLALLLIALAVHLLLDANRKKGVASDALPEETGEAAAGAAAAAEADTTALATPDADAEAAAAETPEAVPGGLNAAWPVMNGILNKAEEIRREEGLEAVELTEEIPSEEADAVELTEEFHSEEADAAELTEEIPSEEADAAEAEKETEAEMPVIEEKPDENEEQSLIWETGDAPSEDAAEEILYAEASDLDIDLTKKDELGKNE